jgi:hypothetical protein
VVDVTPTDRLKGGVMAFARAAFSRVDYYALYAAKAVAQSADGRRLDVVPDDKRLPAMNSVPLLLGLPGATVKVSAGAKVLVGWSGGDPSAPYTTLWNGGETVLTLSLSAAKIELGGTGLTPLDGFVHGRGSDPSTGLPYWMLGSTSGVVLGVK